MRILGFEITRKKGFSALQPSGWWPMIRESYTGAWQSNVEVDAPRNILAFSAVYACVTIIAADIAKLRVKLIRRVSEKDDIWEEVQKGSPFLSVLRKPNHYQSRLKFIEQWIVSKLLTGNVYVLKRRDARGIVNGMYVLDPTRVTPLITEDGGVYYRLKRDDLSGVGDNEVVIPASEIIHDMMVSLFHPLVGVSPIFACGMSATMGNKIQANSTNLFANASRPSGVLSAPGAINEATALRLKTAWEDNYKGTNVGRLAVLGDGLKYEPITMSAEDAQLIEQLKWTVEDVARAFHMPLYKLGGPPPSYNNIEALAQAYYTDCLQSMIESLELSLDNGLDLPEDLGTEVDLDNLLRMDSFTRYERHNKAVGGGWLSPNEARKFENLAPVKGGESPYLQQQNYSLEALSKRDTLDDPFAANTPPPQQDKPSPAANDDEANAEEAAAMASTFIKGLSEPHVQI